MKTPRIKRLPIVLGLFLLFGFLGIYFLTTRSVSNPEFEEQIENFVRTRAPGTEMSLFNGQDLSGWYAFGVGKWSVKEGVVRVRLGHGYLATRCKEFEDFILTLRAKVSSEGNSGVFFRAQPPGMNFRPWPLGYEAQIDNHDPKNPTGSLYDRVPAPLGLARDGEWFDMKVSARDSNIQVAINDAVVVNTTDTDYSKGFIALQAHHPWCTVEFAEVRVRMGE